MDSTRGVEPFFGPTAPQPGRRLLLVSWHFPPSDATGALRWQRLSVFAADRGWGLDVVTEEPGSMERVDWSRMEELPSGTRVFGVPLRRSPSGRALEAFSGLKSALPGSGVNGPEAPERPASSSPVPDPGLVRLRELRWGLGTPRGWKRAVNAWVEEARMTPWARDVARLGAVIQSEGVHAAVISCGPPHVAHSAARRIAERTGVPLVLDFRDPWSLAGAVHAHQASPLAFHLRLGKERAAVERADLILCNTEALTIAMQGAHPRWGNRFLTVRNGCDTGEAVPRPREGRFVVAYAGNIYIDRDPRPLFAAASRLVRSRGLGPDAFSLELMGDVETFGGVTVEALARDAGLADHVRLHTRAPRREAMHFLARASVLVSLPQSADLAVPSKIYEYMQFPARLLVFAARGSATELLLRGSGADVVDPRDLDGITRALDRAFQEHRAGREPPRLAEDPRFSRGREAEILFDALEAVVDGAGKA